MRRLMKAYRRIDDYDFIRFFLVLAFVLVLVTLFAPISWDLVGQAWLGYFTLLYVVGMLRPSDRGPSR